jgi:lysophospholipase L1-like esterase
MKMSPPLQLGILAILFTLGCSDEKNDAAPSGGGGTGGNTSSTATTVGIAGSTATQSSGTGTAGSGGTTGASGTTALTCGSGVVESGFVDVAATDPGIRYVGRMDFTIPSAPKMAFPAVTIETTFEGDAIDMRLTETAAGGTTTTAYYDVSIDSGPPTKLMTCPQQEVYPLARNLAAGTHRVRLSKRTEASVGSSSFLGFRVREGTALTLPEAPTRRLEVVGDSITCGYGNEISTTDPASFTFTSVNENALLAYGAVTAAALNADYVAVSVSGRGMVRNYSGGAGLTAPEFYELTAPNAAWATWDHTRYSPDVIVVNLGTNDFSPGLTAEELVTMRENYRQTYVAFLTHLRTLHPAATLIGAVGPMMSDGYPAGYQAWTSIRADVGAAIDTLTTGGDTNVFYLAFAPQSSPYGEDWHPTVATHQTMANQLATFIEQTKGW